MFESRGAGFRQGIDVHNLAPAPFGLKQGGQHPRMVRARILANYENRVALIEVFEPDRALAKTDNLFHASAARLMTHVRAILQIVRPKLPREQLVQESSFITGPARSVKDRFVR